MTRARDLSRLSNSNALSVDASNRVGIGSTVPRADLDVDGTVLVGNDITIQSGIITAVSATFSGNVSVGGTITYEDVTNVDSVGLITARSGIILTGGDVTLGTGVTISGASANTFTLSTNGSERLRIDSSGNVGIGTALPNYRLDVTSQLGCTYSGALRHLVNIDSDGGKSYWYNGTPTNTAYVLGDTGSAYFAGKLLVGTSSAYDSNDNFVVQKTDGGARIGLQHSTTGQVIADEELGVISFYSNDGDLNPSARISAVADLDHAAGDKPGRLVFSTTADGASSPTARATIDSSGNLGIGMTSLNQTTAGRTVVGINGSDSALLNLNHGNTLAGFLFANSSEFRLEAADTRNLNFRINSTDGMRIASNGYIYMFSVYSNPVVGSYRDVYVESGGFIGYLSSVQAHKTNIQPVEDVDWLYSLNPVSFNRRKKDEKGVYSDEFYEENEYGLIAEEVEPIAPQICFYDLDEQTDEKTLAGVHYRQLITPMLKALQQANTRIEALEAKVIALENN